jgi:mycothiol synthase
MQTRPATLHDLPAIASLQQRFDTAWFGAPELDADEVAESFTRVEPLAECSRLIMDREQLLGAAWWWGSSSTLLVDPDINPRPVHDDLLAWFESQGQHVEALSADLRLTTALTARGWRHVNSSFELIRPVAPDFVLADPVWPGGVTLRAWHAEDARAVHQLIYVDAAWAEIRGHPERTFEDWQNIFVTADTLPEQQVLAWHADRLVGVAMGRTFSDGTGWISQLAVARDARGMGLGRALLLEALRRRREAGATALGLSVQAENRGALSLYLAVGLHIDREWQEYAQ